MLELVLVGLPLSFTALVFSLALVTDPDDVTARYFTTSATAEAQGYSADLLAIELGNKIRFLAQTAATHYKPKPIQIGLSSEPVDKLSDYFQIGPIVKATQELIGIVKYSMEMALLSDASGKPYIILRIHRFSDLSMIFSERISVEGTGIDGLIERAAEDITKLAEPFIFATYLHDQYRRDSQPGTLKKIIDFIQRTLPSVEGANRSWYFNLLGVAAAENGQYDLAIGFYEEALSADTEFVAAKINIGRALHDLEMYEDAVAFYRAALRGDSTEFSIGYVYWAEALLETGDLEEALVKLEVAEWLTPDLARIYQIRGDIFERRGLQEAAEQQRYRAMEARLRQPRQSSYEPV